MVPSKGVDEFSPHEMHHITHQIFPNASMQPAAKTENFVLVSSIWTIPPFRNKLFRFLEDIRVSVSKIIGIKNSIACEILKNIYLFSFQIK